MTESRFSKDLEQDTLWQLLSVGTAVDHEQQDAAEWIAAMHKEHEASRPTPLEDDLVERLQTAAHGRVNNLYGQAAAALEAQQRKIEGLQTFADTVHETAGDRCPWCLSRDHWAGRVELCCAPSSRAVAEALDDGGEK